MIERVLVQSLEVVQHALINDNDLNLGARYEPFETVRRTPGCLPSRLAVDKMMLAFLESRRGWRRYNIGESSLGSAWTGTDRKELEAEGDRFQDVQNRIEFSRHDITCFYVGCFKPAMELRGLMSVTLLNSGRVGHPSL